MNRISIRTVLGFLVLLSCWLVQPKTFAQIGAPRFGNPRLMNGRTPMEWGRPVHRDLKSVAYGNGTFVAVGPSTTILSSKDGINWANRSAQIGNVCANINFTTETYSAGGDTVTFALVNNSWPKFPSDSEMKTNPLAISIYNASVHFPKIPHLLRSITFGRETFVIVGDCGEILTSRDGEHWATPASGSSDTLTSVAWGNSGFVAVGDKGVILTSSDGSIWTKRNSGTDQTLFGLAYGNGTFVVLGDNSKILISSDGIAWTPVDIGSEAMESIAFGNGIFMGTSIDTAFLGKAYLDNHHTMVSTDGKSWHEVRHPYPPEGQAGAMTFYPPDGQAGVKAYREHSGGTMPLTFGSGLFIATSVEGIFTSKDGNSWSPSIEPHGFKPHYYGATFGNGIFVAVGYGPYGTNHMDLTRWMTIATSKEANTWELSQSPPSRLLWGSLWGDKTFSAIGLGEGVYLVTTDGETWTTPDKTSISGSVYGNQVTYSSGKPFVVLSSKDGIVWTRLTPKISDQPVPVIASTIQNVGKSENGVMIELNGQLYKLNLTTTIGQSMEIQASTNLQSWVTLTIITNSGGILKFVDRDASNYPMRFYRLKLQ